jgi:hypothetical protein
MGIRLKEIVTLPLSLIYLGCNCLNMRHMDIYIQIAFQVERMGGCPRMRINKHEQYHKVFTNVATICKQSCGHHMTLD